MPSSAGGGESGGEAGGGTNSAAAGRARPAGRRGRRGEAWPSLLLRPRGQFQNFEVAARVPWERRAPFYFVFFCLKNCSFYFVVWRIPLLFFRGTGIFILNKTGSLQPILQRQT